MYDTENMAQPGRSTEEGGDQELRARLRTLAHDLSNAVETVLQASYLLNQSNLDPESQKWAKLIDTAGQDAARVNRQIRDLLRAESPE
ncbi:MAG: hypothetical protein H0X25_11420 [Acidobacteriales bacterium]|nr:hypothetical protein [Terriglobales bacterium]